MRQPASTHLFAIPSCPLRRHPPIVQRLDHLYFPWPQPEARQAVERFDLGPTQPGRPEICGLAPRGKPQESVPEIEQSRRHWRNEKLLLQVGPPLVCPGTLEKTLQGLAQRMAFLVPCQKGEFALSVLLQGYAERLVKELSANRNSVAWVSNPTRRLSISSL